MTNRPGRTGRNFASLLEVHPHRPQQARITSALVTFLLRSNLANLRGDPELAARAEADLQHAVAFAGKSTLRFDVEYAASREGL